MGTTVPLGIPVATFALLATAVQTFLLLFACLEHIRKPVMVYVLLVHPAFHAPLPRVLRLRARLDTTGLTQVQTARCALLDLCVPRRHQALLLALRATIVWLDPRRVLSALPDLAALQLQYLPQHALRGLTVITVGRLVRLARRVWLARRSLTAVKTSFARQELIRPQVPLRVPLALRAVRVLTPTLATGVLLRAFRENFLLVQLFRAPHVLLAGLVLALTVLATQCAL
jgi:hypothetical protein